MARDFTKSTSNYLSIASWPLSGLPFSVSLLTEIDTTGSGMVPFGFFSSASGGEGFYLSFESGGNVAAISFAGGTFRVSSMTAPSAGVPFQLGGIFNSTASRTIVLDGVLGTENTQSVTGVNPVRTKIGIWDDAESLFSPWDGPISEVGIWDIELAQADWDQLALGVSPLMVRPGSLVEYWPLYGTSSPEQGLVGGLDLAITGSVPKRSHPRTIKPRAQLLQFPEVSGVTSALTGTALATIDEDDITTGGKTIIITLTGDTWKVAGTGPIGSTADTQALIDGFDAASSPTNGWNNAVRDNEVTSAIVRTSSTVATWTITAQASYDISSQETITGTIPTAALTTGAGALTATPTFAIDPVSGFQVAWAGSANTMVQ